MKISNCLCSCLCMPLCTSTKFVLFCLNFPPSLVRCPIISLLVCVFLFINYCFLFEFLNILSGVLRIFVPIRWSLIVIREFNFSLASLSEVSKVHWLQFIYEIGSGFYIYFLVVFNVFFFIYGFCDKNCKQIFFGYFIFTIVLCL